MKRKTKVLIAWICAIVFMICVLLLPLLGFLNSAKADGRPWKVRINDPCNHSHSLNFAKGEVANYWVGSSGNMVCVELTDGREYMTHWNNVVMYKE